MNDYSFIHPYIIKQQRTYETTQYLMYRKHIGSKIILLCVASIGRQCFQIS